MGWTSQSNYHQNLNDQKKKLFSPQQSNATSEMSNKIKAKRSVKRDQSSLFSYNPAENIPQFHSPLLQNQAYEQIFNYKVPLKTRSDIDRHFNSYKWDNLFRYLKHNF